GTITFTVTRSGAAEGSQSVDYALTGNVEAADLGGSLAGGSVTFLQGETSKTITLTLTDDALDEVNETVTVTLSNPTGTEVSPVIGTAASTTTIVDNDNAASISIASPASVNESAGTITFTVTRTGDAEGSQSVNYALSGSVEAADLGGSLAGGSVTFLQGETSKTITLTLTDDALDEVNETVTVTLSNPTGTEVSPVIGTAASTTTIVDNDNAASISIASPASVNESAGTITFTVTRTGDAEGSQSVNYALSGSVEAADLGGSLAGGSVTFLQGETSKTITLTLTDDALDEVNETVTVTLSNPTGTEVSPVIGTAASTTTIVDNDNAASISIASPASVNESAGTITFTVTRTGDAEGSQSVNYALSGSVEAADLGGSLAGGTVTFLQGETSKLVTLTLTDDLLDEINETVTVTLSGPSGTEVTPVIGTAASTTTIIDNDAQTSISIASPASVNESAGTITFTVTRTGDAEGSQSVNYALSGSVEAADLGGSLAGGTVTFLQGETSKLVTLTLTDDLLDEINETVTVTLSGPSGTEVTPVIGTAASTTTIIDNDAQTSISIASPASVNESAGTITFTVTRTGDAEGSQSVNYALSGSVEAADLGGSLAGGTVTFLQGETSKLVTLTLTDDLLDEINETVTVTLSGPSGTEVTPVIGTAASTTTIIDNDNAASISIPASVNENAGTITFTVTRTGDAEGSQSVNYALSGSVEAADLGGSLAG